MRKLNFVNKFKTRIIETVYFRFCNYIITQDIVEINNKTVTISLQFGYKRLQKVTKTRRLSIFVGGFWVIC